MLEASNKKINEKFSYVAVGLAAILLTWSVSTLELVALASRAFAFYYFVQCLVALTVSRSLVQKTFISFVACILLFVTLFAVPVG